LEACEIEIVNKLGLHARAAAQLVRTAGNFGSEIRIEGNGSEADAKSIMSVMMLAASRGTRVRVTAEGEDAAEAIEAITSLVAARFGEDE